jgi:hypothetical protein
MRCVIEYMFIATAPGKALGLPGREEGREERREGERGTGVAMQKWVWIIPPTFSLIQRGNGGGKRSGKGEGGRADDPHEWLLQREGGREGGREGQWGELVRPNIREGERRRK